MTRTGLPPFMYILMSGEWVYTGVENDIIPLVKFSNQHPLRVVVFTDHETAMNMALRLNREFKVSLTPVEYNSRITTHNQD